MQGLNQGATGIYNNGKYIGFNEDNKVIIIRELWVIQKLKVELDPASKVVHKKNWSYLL